MTCKFCGSLLEGNEIECPYCGHKVAEHVVPAVPIEEMAEPIVEKKEEQKAKRTDVKKASVSFGSSLKDAKRKMSEASAKKKEMSSKKTKPSGSKATVNSATISIIGLVACALLCLISIISVAGVKKNLNTMNQDMLSLFYQLQNSNEQLANKVNELEKTLGSVSHTITEAETSKNITITKEPTSTATYLNRGSVTDNTQNVPIFTVYATGFDLTFSWQRYDEVSGSWVNIVWDKESNNEVYGLHVYTDTDKGYTELAAHGVTKEAYGSYRCQIADSYGVKNTDTVVLSERSKES